MPPHLFHIHFSHRVTEPPTGTAKRGDRIASGLGPAGPSLLLAAGNRQPVDRSLAGEPGMPARSSDLYNVTRLTCDLLIFFLGRVDGQPRNSFVSVDILTTVKPAYRQPWLKATG